MSDEAHEVEPVEPPTPSEDPWPDPEPARYEVQFSPSFLAQQQAPDVSGVRVSMTILGVVGAILLLAAGAMIAVIVVDQITSSSSQPVITVALAGVACLIISVAGRRYLLSGGTSTEPEVPPPYAFAITHSTIEFPETPSQSASTWDRSSTTVSVAGDDWTRRLVLRCPGQRNRYFFAWAVVDSPEDLEARILGDREATGLGPHEELGDG